MSTASVTSEAVERRKAAHAANQRRYAERHPDRVKQASNAYRRSTKRREWLDANRESVNASKRRYRERNAEALRVADAQRREANRDAIRARERQRYHADIEASRERGVTYYQTVIKPDPERQMRHRRASVGPARHKRTGWSPGQYEAAMEAQDGKCAICLGDDGERGLHADHDHETGAGRKLLCRRCNNGLGHFRDSPELLLGAYLYLLTAGRR